MKTPMRRKGRPRSTGSTTGQGTIQALVRALDVLDAIGNANGMTLSGIAAELGQSPATIHRILSTLEARAIVENDPATQTWHVGPSAFRLGSAFLRRSGVVERSRPVMHALMESTGETSNLGIERGGHVMFVSQVETHESIRAFFPPGTLSPLHASGIGKALLSLYPDARLAEFLRGRVLERFTPRTLTDAAALGAELLQIRSRGYAVDDEEKAEGMRCVAAPIVNFYGEAVAGISVSGPTHRMPAHRLDDIGAMVRAAAAAVSRGLGAPDQPG